ncbi:hypothetical protein J2S74_004975 [Evansella vedderi]|uniref:Uncharacterized protein n=1 Tax=Evansella vedderi TaxID=38282 RepID=A0ABU0A3D4_9BACI|nr:hypothetical protein [Evansella vedderi]MDQ0257517.1 hypothetical protein [Evansella vedderi]
MRRIMPSSISSYSQYGHLKIPKCVKSECPQCGINAEFTLKVNYQSNRVGLFSQGDCSKCKNTSSFVIMIGNGLEKTGEVAEVYIYDQRHPLHQMKQYRNIPDDLVRAYRSAINVHQSKDTSATAVMSKRVLQSMINSFLAENKLEGKPLSEQLEMLPEYVDFTRPISSLRSLIHPDSHFQQMLELERDLDEDMAGLIVDLLNNLIEYLYILPSRMDFIHDQIEERLK